MDPRGYHQKSTRETVHFFDSLCHFRSAVYGKAESSQSWWGRMLFSPVRVFVPFSIDVFSRVAFEKVNSIRFVRSGRWFSWWFVSSFLLGGGVENRNKKKTPVSKFDPPVAIFNPEIGEKMLSTVKATQSNEFSAGESWRLWQISIHKERKSRSHPEVPVP